MLTMAAAASPSAISREVLQTTFSKTRLSSIIPSTASRPWSRNTLSYNNCRRTCPVEVRIGVAYDAVTKEREELMDEIHRRMDRIKENPTGASFTEEDVLAALDDPEFNTSENFEERYSVKGKIFYTDPDGAMVDINAKAPAFLPVRECSMYNILMPGQAGIRPGLEEEFAIIGEDKKGVSLVLSLREVQKSLAWERCRQLQLEDVTVKAKVLSANKGGLMVILESLEGFIPFSQVATTTQLEDLVNKELPVKIVDTNEEEGRLVLSNRKAVVENQAQLELGTVVLGTVQSIKPYGAFIDLGTISGLLHVSQISHDRVTDVGAILQPGDTLKVMVMSHDRERGRVSLSTKKLEPTPGDMLRNPKLVYEKAEEMAETFKNRVAQAYALARSQSAFSSTVGGGFNLDLDGVIDPASKQNSRLSIEDLDSSAQDDSQ